MPKYEYEVSGENNNSLVFRPCDQKLRGEWNCGRAAKYDAGAQIRKLAHEVGDIPGERVWVDTDRMSWGYYDPLNYPEMSAEESRIKTAVKRYALKNTELFSGGGEVDFRSPVTRENCDENEIKDVMYWLRLALDDKAVKPVPGTQPLPSLKEIQQMPGRRDLHGDPLVDKESIEAIQRFLHDVPVTKRTAKSGS